MRAPDPGWQATITRSKRSGAASPAVTSTPASSRRTLRTGAPSATRPRRRVAERVRRRSASRPRSCTTAARRAHRAGRGCRRSARRSAPASRASAPATTTRSPRPSAPGSDRSAHGRSPRRARYSPIVRSSAAGSSSSARALRKKRPRSTSSRANDGRTRLRRWANRPRRPWPENSRSQRSQRTENDIVRRAQRHAELAHEFEEFRVVTFVADHEPRIERMSVTEYGVVHAPLPAARLRTARRRNAGRDGTRRRARQCRRRRWRPSPAPHSAAASTIVPHGVIIPRLCRAQPSQPRRPRRTDDERTHDRGRARPTADRVTASSR